MLPHTYDGHASVRNFGCRCGKGPRVFGGGRPSFEYIRTHTSSIRALRSGRIQARPVISDTDKSRRSGFRWVCMIVNSRHRGGFQWLRHRSTRDGLTTGSLNVPLKSNGVFLRRPRLIVGFEIPWWGRRRQSAPALCEGLRDTEYSCKL